MKEVLFEGGGGGGEVEGLSYPLSMKFRGGRLLLIPKITEAVIYSYHP